MTGTDNIISQADLDNLLRINEFIKEEDDNSLISEMKSAILDSARLELSQWLSLRQHIQEIEALVPHIDLIIKLKQEASKARKN